MSRDSAPKRALTSGNVLSGTQRQRVIARR
jgi:hypothetical protein